MINILLAFLISFLTSIILLPIIIKVLRKIKASQTILSYVENHKDKNGTPTMGGVVFIITTLGLSFCFLKFNNIWFVTLLIGLFFGVLGLMDDYLKVKYRQNLGLRPYQKIIGQVGISLIFAIFVYFNVGSTVFVPFTNIQLNFGIFIIPFIMLVLIATTNSVNLTDGLDGLAGSVSMFYLVFFIAIISIFSNRLYFEGETGNILTNIYSVQILSSLFVGSILGFLMFNTSRASIFMGDAGSLCLGGFIGASSCILGLEFLIIILGICFVFSAISVILQVAVFKLKHKRIFKMAPFHHHLQMSGLSEPKIVAIYSATTICVGIICLIFYLA